MPKASFVFLSGEKYCDDFIFDKPIDLYSKICELSRGIKNGDKFMYIKLVLGETDIIYNNICWYYCDFLRNINEDIIVTIIKINLLEHINDTKKNEEIIKDILIDDYEDDYIKLYAEHFSTFLKNDIVAEVAILNYPIFLKYANNKLKNNENLVLQCIHKDDETFKYISNKLKNNHDFILKAVKIGHIYQYINDEFKKDKQIINMALRYNKAYFKDLPDEFKNDKDYVLKLINNNMINCKILNISDFHNNNNNNKFKILPTSLKYDKDILITSIKNEILTTKYFNHKTLFKNNKIEEIYDNKDHNIVLKTILNDRNILFEFVKKDSSIFDYVDDRYIDDIEMIEIVIMSNPHLIKKVSNNIKKNKDLILYFIKKNSKIIENKDIRELYCNDREIMLEIIKNNVELFCYASKELKNDEHIKSIALEMYLKAAKNKFQTDIIEKETAPIFSISSIFG